jgi:MFS family permease
MNAETAPRNDARVISLIGVAHCLSHVYQLALPALFTLIHAADGYSYTQLGLLATVFFIASGLGQTPAGFLVDRFGARPILLTGFFMIAGAATAFSIADSYPIMIFLAMCAGLGNSVFHPADYSILNASVSEARIGRGYAIHGFGGFVGYAATPLGMYTLGSAIGWRPAILIVGIGGLVVLFLVWLNRSVLKDSAVDQGIKSKGLRKEIGVLFQGPTILSFGFFCFMAMGSIGLMTLGATTLAAFTGLGADVSSQIISAQLTGTLGGILAGGFLVDRYSRHDLLTAIVVTAAVAILMIVPLFQPSSHWVLFPVFVLFGMFYGIAGPARDMVVRSIAPKGAAGKVFGFTYSGMDFGAAISTSIFGILLDRGQPGVIFVLIGFFMMLGVVSVLGAKYMSRRKAAMATA